MNWNSLELDQQTLDEQTWFARNGKAARLLALVVCSFTLACSGCSERNLAPEMPYDQAQSEALRDDLNTHAKGE